MIVSIEQHVDWIVDCLEHMQEKGYETIEPTAVAEAGWMQHVNDWAAITLAARANSWYMGANAVSYTHLDVYRRQSSAFFT